MVWYFKTPLAEFDMIHPREIVMGDEHLYFVDSAGIWRLNIADAKAQCLFRDHRLGHLTFGNLGAYVIYFDAIYHINDNILSLVADTESPNEQHPQKRCINGFQLDNNGNFLICENNNLMKINKDGIIDTVAQRVYNAFGNSYVGIAVRNDGTIFVCDPENHCIRSIFNGVESVVAGFSLSRGWADGSLAQAAFNTPSGLVLENDHTLLVTQADTTHGNIRRINLAQKTVSTLHLWSQCSNGISRDIEGNMYVCSQRILYKLENVWKYHRFLWIGYLKEGKTYCRLPWLPKELIKVISAFLLPNNDSIKKGAVDVAELQKIKQLSQ